VGIKFGVDRNAPITYFGEIDISVALWWLDNEPTRIVVDGHIFHALVSPMFFGRCAVLFPHDALDSPMLFGACLWIFL